MTEHNEKEIEEEVYKAFQELVEASQELNFDRYLSLFNHEKFSGLHANGTVMHSILDLVQTYRPGFGMIEKVEHLKFSNVKITVINERTAILVNEYREVSLLKNGDRVEGKGGGTQVWEKSDRDWKLVSVSSSNGN